MSTISVLFFVALAILVLAILVLVQFEVWEAGEAEVARERAKLEQDRRDWEATWPNEK